MAIDDRRRRAPRALQVSAWRGNLHIAVLSPAPGRPTPGVAAISAELARLRGLGVTRVLTGALHEVELDPFLATGFTTHERLHLLRHDLTDIPPAGGAVRTRRAWRRDLPTILDIDGRAFDEFWALDRRGLEDAVRATPRSRFRVSGAPGPVPGVRITGYAVTGQAEDRGYLQRLAVDPELHRAGIGRALVIDSLRWLRRQGARVAMVNTQEHNHGALALYEACGFGPEPSGLTVLERDLAADPTDAGPDLAEPAEPPATGAPEDHEPRPGPT